MIININDNQQLKTRSHVFRSSTGEHIARRQVGAGRVSLIGTKLLKVHLLNHDNNDQDALPHPLPVLVHARPALFSIRYPGKFYRLFSRID